MATRRWISTGSGDWASTSNWSGSAVPTSGDTVVFEKNQYDVTGSLNQATVSNITLVVHQSFTGKIGDVDNYLQLTCTSVEIGRDDENQRPAGSSRLNLNIGTSAATVNVINTGQLSADDGYHPVRLLATNSATKVNIRRGKVEIAGFTGETATVDDIEFGRDGGNTTDTQLKLGSGVTMDDMNIRAGYVLTRANVDSVTIYGGVLETDGTATLATCNVRGGRLVANSSGTITNLRLAYGGEVDFQGANVARTVSNCLLFAPSRIKTHPTVTFTNGFAPQTDTPLDVAVG